MTDTFRPASLTWVLGIEDTCVYPPVQFAMGALDEYELTDHTRTWREDLATVKDLGASAVRYGVSWPLAHTGPTSFDWSMLDERLQYAAGELGLTVIADLVHYGTPTWLQDSFADPGYPGAIASFAAAFAGRYAGLVDHITPLNEPLTTASFCGLRGVWPPALNGWHGWTTVTTAIVRGIRQTIAAVRAANPDAVIVHVEASGLYSASHEGLAGHAELLRSIADLPTELLHGRVTPQHPMHAWLLDHGAHSDDLQAFQEDVPAIDLLGVNYYPDLTPRTLVEVKGEVQQVTTNRWQEGLRLCLKHFAQRYDIPLLVTETSIEGSEDLRADWLAVSARTVQDLRIQGLDIRGYTWWPLFDFVDWSYASGGRNVEEFLLPDPGPDAPTPPTRDLFADVTKGRQAFLRRMGLLGLQEQADGTLQRIPTLAAATFHNLAHQAQVTIERASPTRCRRRYPSAKHVTGCSASNFSELVQHLVDRGYLIRTPDPNDRRARLLVLTDRGHACTRAAQEAAAHVVDRWHDHLPVAQQATLPATLAAIATPGRLRPAW